MARPKESLEKRMLDAQVAVDNANSDEEIKSYVVKFGYDGPRLAVGKALLDETRSLHQKQQKEYGDQYQAKDDLDELRYEANKEYMRYVKIARIALNSEHALYLKLGLIGNRKSALPNWLGQAKQFYINSLSDTIVLEKMTEFGVEQNMLEAGNKLVDAVEKANADLKKEMGEAQQATQERDQALEVLEEWVSNLKAIARIALEDKPQLLEKLGVVVRS